VENSGFSEVPGSGRVGQCAACKMVFGPNLEQGGNIDVVVRRDPVTSATTGGLVHRKASAVGDQRVLRGPGRHRMLSCRPR
jgi:hypothetical protein